MKMKAMMNKRPSLAKGDTNNTMKNQVAKSKAVVSAGAHKGSTSHTSESSSSSNRRSVIYA